MLVEKRHTDDRLIIFIYIVAVLHFMLATLHHVASFKIMILWPNCNLCFTMYLVICVSAILVASLLILINR